MTSQSSVVRKFRLQPLSLVRMFWKHKLLCVLVWVVLSAGGVAVVHSLTNVFRAEALILVESQKIAEKLVESTVNDELKERLSSLSQQILVPPGCLRSFRSSISTTKSAAPTRRKKSSK